jgi:hypothetical protein
MAGKSIPASRLRAMLAKQLQVLEALGDAEVPASAHNGAMSSYQSTLAAARAAGVAAGTPDAGAAAGAYAPGAGNPGADAGTSGHFHGQQSLAAEMAAHAQAAAAVRQQQQAEDDALAQAVVQSRLERAQAEAAKRWPAAVPLLDMVEFDPNDLDGYMAQVEQLSTALGGQPADATPPPPVGPPVVAGNVPVYPPDPYGPLDEAKAEARRTGNWSAYFRAKEAMARGELPPSF